MNQYSIFTTITDQGPFITGLILHFDSLIRGTEICAEGFNVYVERRDEKTGEVLPVPNFGGGPVELSLGYRKVLDAYPCTPEGKRLKAGKDIFLELGEAPLGKRTQGSMLESRYIDVFHRITQLCPIPAEDPNAAPLCGNVFTECIGDVSPQTEGWAVEHVVYGEGTATEGVASETKDKKKGLPEKLGYAYFIPTRKAPKNFLRPGEELKSDEKLPLVIWLHGAGEGGEDPWIAVTGNKVVNMSSNDLQNKLGGAAFVLAPQCPTVWMDDGVEQLGTSNQSIYVKLVKQCIDDFVEAHKEQIDTDRIMIGGDSNGGFMTMRMIVDYPDFFAAAFPACQVFYSENLTEEMLQSIKDNAIWFIHSRQDELVPPMETSVPIYHRLIEAGAKDVHFTFLDHMEDLTGMYKDEKGRPMRIFNHGVWIHVYNDQIDTDFDGTKVCVDGQPSTLFEWLGSQRR